MLKVFYRFKAHFNPQMKFFLILILKKKEDMLSTIKNKPKVFYKTAPFEWDVKSSMIAVWEHLKKFIINDIGRRKVNVKKNFLFKQNMVKAYVISNFDLYYFSLKY